MPLFTPEAIDLVPAESVVDRLGHGPLRYARAAVAIARMDTEVMAVVARDPDAIGYGIVLMMATSACGALLQAVVSQSLLRAILTLIFVPTFTLVVSAISTAAMHGAAKVIFGATGKYGALLRVLWLGSLVNVLAIIPVLGSIVSGLWSLLIMMVTFQEVDGIDRIQALGLSLGLTAVIYFLFMLAASALGPVSRSF